MSNIIKLDSANRPETPTLILSKKNGEHIGVLSNATQIRHKANLNSYDEISFTVYKQLQVFRYVKRNCRICTLMVLK